jgi:hypothetical protein
MLILLYDMCFVIMHRLNIKKKIGYYKIELIFSLVYEILFTYILPSSSFLFSVFSPAAVAASLR